MQDASETEGCTEEEFSFHSLQTGKCFARGSNEVEVKFLGEFRFPPNGKVLGKRKKGSKWTSAGTVSIPSKRESAWQGKKKEASHGESHQVSIPSKRESAWQERRKQYTALDILSFHSLQTGKCLASQIRFPEVTDVELGFHSLQTGKCLASRICVRDRRSIG